jgi:hypothetical protein
MQATTEVSGATANSNAELAKGEEEITVLEMPRSQVDHTSNISNLKEG